jgi:hypothetical protein
MGGSETSLPILTDVAQFQVDIAGKRDLAEIYADFPVSIAGMSVHTWEDEDQCASSPDYGVSGGQQC